ncbi:MAG: hypothetical protein M0022_08410 [Desulfobacteraceae bacterium]|nr:hypothetical protein [Desulfobacteraceae bacterium]
MHAQGDINDPHSYAKTLIFLIGLLGIGNFNVILILLVFTICYTILVLYSGCTKISKISEGGSAIAVPLMLILSAWFSKLIFSVLLKNL